jgi:hypothetical protein
MAHLLLRGSIFRNILVVTVSALALACIETPVALAQHGGGGHMGGGGSHIGGGGLMGVGHFSGGHFSGGGHVGAPHVFAPRTAHAAMLRPRGFAGPPPAGAGVRTIHSQHHPTHVFHHHVFFGPPFHRFRHGFNSFWWPYWCPYYWGWGFNCYGWPSYSYGYGFGTYTPNYSPEGQSVAPTNGYRAQRYDEERHGLPQLYLKDGTVYDVTDYWLENGQIHFTVPGESGTKSVEHVIGFDELDVQRTVDVNTQRGFGFVLRSEPTE